MGESKSTMANMRIAPSTRARIDAVIAARKPYPPSITQIMERGLELALDELERATPTDKEADQ